MPLNLNSSTIKMAEKKPTKELKKDLNNYVDCLLPLQNIYDKVHNDDFVFASHISTLITSVIKVGHIVENELIKRKVKIDPEKSMIEIFKQIEKNYKKETGITLYL